MTMGAEAPYPPQVPTVTICNGSPYPTAPWIHSNANPVETSSGGRRKSQYPSSKLDLCCIQDQVGLPYNILHRFSKSYD